MDVKYINPFVAAVRNVFHTMLGVEVKIGKPYVKDDERASADVSAIIGFSGDAAGCVVISFPKDVGVKAASTFAGMELGEDHPDFADALGELANMVAGNAKKDFEGVEISISLPSVIIGQSHKVSRSNTFPRVVIPCDTSLGQFYVEVGMKIEKAATVSTG
ncbi:MAG: chemotaxis protein CheX [Phycisphaerae bacterium]|nr:chemotaxis protein CheX [Phycisphaerae bacterium]